MNRISPHAEFQLALFAFRQDPKDAAIRDRLGAAIDAWRAARWHDARTYSRQLVTATERALSARPEDLDKALGGIAEVFEHAKHETSMEDQVALERARTARRGGAGVSSDPSAPPHTRWDERADLA